MNVLVLGGSGFVGRALCEQLQRAGHRVTVPTRRDRQARPLLTLPAVTVHRGDVLRDEAFLAQLLAGQDAVINLIAILHGSAADFERIQVQWPHRLARACLKAQVPRLLHLSALGVEGAEASGSHYLMAKARGETTLRAQSGLQWTIYRPSVIFGAEDQFMNLFAGLQRGLPVMALGGATARLQPVWVGDVVRALVHGLTHPETIGQTYELAGPEVFTLRELVQLAGRWAHCPRPVLALPPALAWLQAWVFEHLPGPLLSRDNLRSLRVPNVATGHLPGLSDLGLPAHSLKALAPTYLKPRALA